MTDIVKIPMEKLRFSTTANSERVYPGDFNGKSKEILPAITITVPVSAC